MKNFEEQETLYRSTLTMMFIIQEADIFPTTTKADIINADAYIRNLKLIHPARLF